MRKLVAFVLISTFIFSALSFAGDPFRLNKMEEGLNNILVGTVETPDNINETNTKGTPAFPDCTDKTKDGVGRAIVKVVGGIWQVATFWYPKD